MNNYFMIFYYFHFTFFCFFSRKPEKWLKPKFVFLWFKVFLYFMILGQGWPTQIGLWAATWKFCQNYRLFGPHDIENLKKYTQNVEKSLIFDSSLGRRKFVLGHPCFRGFIYDFWSIYHYFFLSFIVNITYPILSFV
jgi:hypothetical protein